MGPGHQASLPTLRVDSARFRDDKKVRVPASGDTLTLNPSSVGHTLDLTPWYSPATQACLKNDDVVEVSPDLPGVLQQISRLLTRHGGAGVLIDYGYTTPEVFESTLQSVYQHKSVSPLEYMGQADITAHVNFYAVERFFQALGVSTKVMTQRAFLKGMGSDLRYHQLCQNNPSKQAPLAQGYSRLVEDMGMLYKVCTIER